MKQESINNIPEDLQRELSGNNKTRQTANDGAECEEHRLVVLEGIDNYVNLLLGLEVSPQDVEKHKERLLSNFTEDRERKPVQKTADHWIAARQTIELAPNIYSFIQDRK